MGAAPGPAVASRNWLVCDTRLSTRAPSAEGEAERLLSHGLSNHWHFVNHLLVSSACFSPAVSGFSYESQEPVLSWRRPRARWRARQYVSRARGLTLGAGCGLCVQRAWSVFACKGDLWALSVQMRVFPLSTPSSPSHGGSCLVTPNLGSLDQGALCLLGQLGSAFG